MNVSSKINVYFTHQKKIVKKINGQRAKKKKKHTSISGISPSMN